MELFLKQILEENKITESKTVSNVIYRLIDNVEVVELSKSISEKKKKVLDIFIMYKEKEEFKEKYIAIENANAKKEYNFTFCLENFPNIIIKNIQNLEDTGLQFDAENNRIYGMPTIARTLDLNIVFYSKNDKNQSEDIKVIPFIINADPKDLWKDIPSDKNLRYAKKDTETFSDVFLDKKVVIASRRGRSHAHEGSFRDDDFKAKKLHDGWAIIAVADGAGSAKYSRKGSELATSRITESFNNKAVLSELTEKVNSLFLEDSKVECVDEGIENCKAEYKLKQKSSIINILYKEVRVLHNYLIEFAGKEEIQLKDLNTTLIFALCKKFDFGYVVLNFGVGDCPINLISKDFEKVELLNILDIGEFGGGTRFITMPDIFRDNSSMVNRFSINKIDDFSHLVLMTDGVYDPKFVTENKLEDLKSWSDFWKDLGGDNEDSLVVDFKEDSDIASQLLKWLEFWSKGNHDDRTLAIIY